MATQSDSITMDVDLNAISGGAEPVRVGVILVKIPDAVSGGDCEIHEDGRGVDYTSGRNEETTSFSFEGAVMAEDLERLEPAFLEPLAKSVSCGYTATLLISGAHRRGNSGTLIDDDIIKKILWILFSRVAEMKEEIFSAVSFVQFFSDDDALDLLNPERRRLKPVSHPVLGCLVEGLCEVSVGSAEEACGLYETGRQRLRDTAAGVGGRCSSLFSVAIEQRLHPETDELEFCRSRLQLFSLAGGASQTGLKGVSPMVRVLEQLQLGTTASTQVLPFLLTEALTGNSRTCLLHCIQPHGRLDEETPAALTLAHRVKGLATKPTNGRWCPKVTERDIRLKIQGLRSLMMSQKEHGGQNTYRLAELTENLQIVKDQSWEERWETSERIKDKIKASRSTKGKLHSDGDPSIDSTDVAEKMKYLQEQLRQQMEEHIREGKGSVEKVQERLTRIQQLRGRLREEMMKQGVASERSDLSQQPEYSRASQQRRQMKEDHDRLIQEEVEKMEEELKQAQAEGVQRELLVMARERQVLTLQMEALRTEAQLAEGDLEEQRRRNQQELLHLREESLQVFRVFRQVSEEQKRTMEGRYRSLLLEAVQDAVYLSAQNQQLQADNTQLRTALGELKDAQTTRGDTKAEISNQQ